MSTTFYNSRLARMFGEEVSLPENVDIRMTNWGMDGFVISINEDNDLEIVELPQNFDPESWLNVIQQMREQGLDKKTAMRANALEFAIHYIKEI